MNVECPRCWKARWHATGGFNVSRHGRPRAELVCEFCSYAWSCGLPAAIEAGEAVLAQHGGPLVPPAPVPVPAPSLPLGIRRAPDFATPGEIARSVRFNRMQDARMRQTGEKD